MQVKSSKIKSELKGGENGTMDSDGERRRIRGARLRRLRKRLGITQIELGRMIGAKSPSATISLIERGLQSMSVDQIEKLAQALLELIESFLKVISSPNGSTKSVIKSILSAAKANN